MMRHDRPSLLHRHAVPSGDEKEMRAQSPVSDVIQKLYLHEYFHSPFSFIHICNYPTACCINGNCKIVSESSTDIDCNLSDDEGAYEEFSKSQHMQQGSLTLSGICMRKIRVSVYRIKEIADLV